MWLWPWAKTPKFSKLDFVKLIMCQHPNFYHTCKKKISGSEDNYVVDKHSYVDLGCMTLQEVRGGEGWGVRKKTGGHFRRSKLHDTASEQV